MENKNILWSSDVIEKIQENIKKGKYRFSGHAVKSMLKRSIGHSEVKDAIITGEIIEKYPGDKYSPSCLIYGKTKEGINLHVQISLPPSVVVITVYKPDTIEWIDYKIRR